MLKTMLCFAITPNAANPSIDWTFYSVIERNSEFRLLMLFTHQTLRISSNESGNNGQISRESSQEAPPSSVSVETPSISTVEPPQSTPTYYPSQPVVPDMHQQPMIARYTSNLFRTPQLPRTPRLSSSGSIALSPPSSRQK
jgi:hypothetical protein